ncbi:UbiA family prenyltransferase [Streptomyces sp. SBST2-5]|uniref:UbiA family prenyltransferase n=1 Tax=Streptomyces composti TaxID=2720025 RepID=A0ABX1A0T9_9ACTN|nr:UbiA family prenyltransferase [Streptomyces composti]NJP49825.1 UbiA family prenyltransferase [Streptomyces composti]
MSSTSTSTGDTSTLRAWAELLRLPALFSVPGDALAGAAAIGVRPGRGTLLAIGSSLCLYEAGMALNDWADRAEDAVDRPHRPIPSGRIHPTAALTAATAFTAAGVALAHRAGRTPGALAAALAATVWAYDLHLKHTPAGPAAMGTARALDVLLGAAATAGGQRPASAAQGAAGRRPGRGPARRPMATPPAALSVPPPPAGGPGVRSAPGAPMARTGRAPGGERGVGVPTAAGAAAVAARSAAASRGGRGRPSRSVRRALAAVAALMPGGTSGGVRLLPGAAGTPSARPTRAGKAVSAGAATLAAMTAGTGRPGSGRSARRAGLLGPVAPGLSSAGTPTAGRARPARPVGLRAALPAALAMAAHTTAVTFVSRDETTGGKPLVPAAALAATATVTTRLLKPPAGRGGAAPLGLPGPLAYAATVARPLFHAALNPSPPLTQRAVGAGIRAMIPLQAALAARAGAPGSALATAALAPLARRFARKVSVT